MILSGTSRHNSRDIPEKKKATCIKVLSGVSRRLGPWCPRNILPKTLCLGCFSVPDLKAIDDRQIARLICARLKYDLYDLFRGCFWAFYTRERGSRPKTPPKKSYRSYFRRAQIRWVIWRKASDCRSSWSLVNWGWWSGGGRSFRIAACVSWPAALQWTHTHACRDRKPCFEVNFNLRSYFQGFVNRGFQTVVRDCLLSGG